jgi:hypothetical protein
MASGEGKAESREDRLNRELIELLNELRVALPGVQVLFAFLLAVPFASGFPKLSSLDRDVFSRLHRHGARDPLPARAELLSPPSLAGTHSRPTPRGFMQVDAPATFRSKVRTQAQGMCGPSAGLFALLESTPIV